MLSIFLRSFSRRELLFNNALKLTNIRLLYDSASEEHNIKKFKLIKRLAYTILFGGTFLIVLWAKKKKRSTVFDDAKLVTNSNYHKNFKLYDYKGFVLPSFVMKNLANTQNFIFKEDDVLVVSFPKTGTTWLQEIIYCILKGIDASLSQSLEDRFPYLEFIYPGLASINKIDGQRLIKTHLPYSFLPEDIHKKNPKIFYILRNPKDVAVSYYHFVRMMTITDYTATFDSFFQDFISDKIAYGPIWKHYEDVWEHRNDPNVLILFYEDLQKDIHGSIRKVANFLNKELSEKEINDIADHCSFNSMSQNPNVNYQHWDDLGIRKINEAKFMRKGEVGDWKNYFSPEMNYSVNLWIEEKFKDIATSFSYTDSKET